MSRCFVSRGRPFVTFRRVSQFCVAGTMLLRRFQKMNSGLRGRRGTLDIIVVTLRGRPNALNVSCCVLCANRSVRAASSGDKCEMR